MKDEGRSWRGAEGVGVTRVDRCGGVEKEDEGRGEDERSVLLVPGAALIINRLQGDLVNYGS